MQRLEKSYREVTNARGETLRLGVWRCSTTVGQEWRGITTTQTHYEVVIRNTQPPHVGGVAPHPFETEHAAEAYRSGYIEAIVAERDRFHNEERAKLEARPACPECGEIESGTSALRPCLNCC
jgi:hypothetical protein